MTQLFGLAIFTKKEVMQLLIDEKKASYRKGYKAGAAMKYRHTPKPLVTTDGIELEKVYCPDFTPPPGEMMFDYDAEGNLRVTYPIVVDNPPTVYGDSLPVKETDEGVTGC